MEIVHVVDLVIFRFRKFIRSIPITIIIFALSGTLIMTDTNVLATLNPNRMTTCQQYSRKSNKTFGTESDLRYKMLDDPNRTMAATTPDRIPNLHIANTTKI